MNPIKYRRFVSSVTEINSDTGEIVKLIKTVSGKTETQETFYMVFESAKSALAKLTASEARMFNIFCLRMEVGNLLPLTGNMKKDIIEELGISQATYYNNMNQLKKLELIFGKGSDFIVNPRFVWKGSTRDRIEALKDMYELK